MSFSRPDNRTLVRVPLLALVLACLALPAQAQPDRPPRGGHGRHQKGPDWERRRQRWRRFRESLGPEEWRRFRNQSRREQRRQIDEAFRSRARRQKQERARRFLAGLPEQERKRIQELPEQERSRALLELRLDRRLAGLIATARERGVIEEAEAAGIRAEQDLKKRAGLVLALQKSLFLNTFSEALEAMSAAERSRLKALPPRRFFRERAIHELPVVRYFDLRRVRRARRGNREMEEALRVAGRTGEVTPELEPLFRKGRLQEFRKLPAVDRKRSFQQLGGSLFRRGPGRHRGGRGPGPRGGGQRVVLREFLQRLGKLPKARREALLDLPLPRVLERLFPERSRQGPGRQRRRGPGRDR